MDDVREVDCPWFEEMWCKDHPEFPLATPLMGEERNEPCQL